MAVFKCKMCGGSLELRDESVAVCEYCGMKQTIPRLDSERKAALYDRAGHFRSDNEFEKAAAIYEQIITEDTTDAEAYWSLVLCRFGIEYVEDPTTRKRIPTINRTQLTSVFDDENYRAALQYADPLQRELYEEEAGRISGIQREFLAISEREDPYDVFICYKETDRGGRRNMDSVLANDLYDQLTKEGLKVFFSRITLEDKLGIAYEPYIFAALSSAKVMVVLATCPEHLQAAWVRNEWSRYLALIRGGAQKVLIPAYRNMDPYSLPEEFSHLQAQDMSRLGFMQDMVRGIKKIVSGSSEGKVGVAPLLKRVQIFLEDGDWSSADEYCEKVLDADPENARAYLGKLMAEVHAHRPEELATCPPFDGSNHYRRVLRYGDDRLVAELNSYLEAARQNGGRPRPVPMEPVQIPSAGPAKLPKWLLPVIGVGILAVAAVVGAGLLVHEHTWVEASCTAPKTCRECGETEGVALSHAWMEATADKPKTCALCGLTDGVSLNEALKQAAAAEMEKAKELMNSRQYVKAARILNEVYLSSGDKEAYSLLVECRKKQGTFNSSVVAAGKDNTAIIDGGVLRVVGDYSSDEFLATGISKIAAVAMGDKHLIALQKDGMVVAWGSNHEKQLNGVNGLRNVATLAAGDFHSVALLEDGLVYASEGYDHCGECSVDKLRLAANGRQIVAVSAAYDHTLALLEDGCVVACGDEKAPNNTVNGAGNVSYWRDVVAICSGTEFSAGLCQDGTVMLSGVNWDVSGWKDIVNIAAGDYYLVGVRENGTVVAVGDMDAGNSYEGYHAVGSLKDVVYVAAGHDHTVAVDKYGVVHCVGSNEYGQCDVDGMQIAP